MQQIPQSGSTHFPSVPPQHPAFRTLVRSVAERIASHGPRAAAAMCRAKAKEIFIRMAAGAAGDEAVQDAMILMGVSSFDLDRLGMWLLNRANELDGSVQ
jgi:hypothetical protein